MSAPYLDSMPDELFFRIVVGESGYIDLVKNISSVTSANKALNNRVQCLWKQIIANYELIDLLFPNKTQALENSIEFIKLNHKTLAKWSFLDLSQKSSLDMQKWRSTDISVNESEILGLYEQCLLYNSQGNPELWVMGHPRNTLFCVDLKSQENSSVALKETVGPASYRCDPFMTESQSWVGVCCDLDEANTKQIVIIDKKSGVTLHKISCIGTVLKIEQEDNHLYVLCKDRVGYKLLNYNGNAWETLPKELRFQEPVSTFYIGLKHFLFLSEKNHPLAISKDEYASANEHSLIRGALEIAHQRIQVNKDGFYVLTKESSRIVVSSLFVTHSAIRAIPLQTISLNINEVVDFNIQLNKIFIFTSNGCLLYYNLTNGELGLRFKATKRQAFGAFVPILAASGPEKIQVLFSSLRVNANATVSPNTALLTLNFMKV